MALNPANDDLRRDDLVNDGLMHENTFNDALARALARQRRQWRDNPRAIIAQRTGVIRDNPASGPTSSSIPMTPTPSSSKMIQ